MGLPFKNGFELAQAMGYGKMYQASKQQEENNIQIESKNMNKNLIRLTESDIHNIVKEAVNKILSEIKYGGESLHGGNASDWHALSQVRAQRHFNKYGDKQKLSKQEWDDELTKGWKDYRNAGNIDYSIPNGNGHKGLKKGNRMIDNLGI